ncbi:MAG: hypothetical protein ACK559_27555, partial [bacterium]
VGRQHGAVRAAVCGGGAGLGVWVPHDEGDPLGVEVVEELADAARQVAHEADQGAGLAQDLALEGVLGELLGQEAPDVRLSGGDRVHLVDERLGESLTREH